jgi:hypothetical protein
MATVSNTRVRGGTHSATWRVPRTRGATSGFLVLLLGAWGALVPFIGPHFGYAYTPNATWVMTSGRLWLELIPGVVAALGGLIMIASASRAVGLWAGWLSAVAGAWFVVGPTISRFWNGGQPATGTPVGTTTVQRVVEEIGFFSGLGVVILFLAATALGRFSVVGLKEHTQAVAAAEAEEAEMAEPVTEEVPASRMPVGQEHVIERERAEQETTTMPVAEKTTSSRRFRRAERSADENAEERAEVGNTTEV